MKILVTGGAGYVGSILTGTLLQMFAGRGSHVTVLDTFSHGENSLAHLCSNPRLTVIRGDARDARTLSPLVKSHDVIIPLAALVGAPLCAFDPAGAHSTNTEAVLKVCSYSSPSQRIIIPTTNSMYGTSDGVCDETSPINPLSVYARTKVNAERYVLEAGGISLRLATVFGASPRMRLDLLVNEFVYRAVKERSVVLFEAHFVRNYIHVRDVASAFVHALDNYETMQGEIYNVGLSDANLTKAHLCAAIQRRVPAFIWSEAAIGKDLDQRNYTVSNAKIEATGWRPQHSLDDGIVELMKLYQGLRNARYGNV